MAEERSYLPAAGRRWALPLYDPLLRLLGLEALKRNLLDPAVLAGARRVLDLGCGTGTLAIALQRRYPALEVSGLDPDSHSLARARRKAARAGVEVRFEQGFADAMPYPDASFDRVVSSLAYHHIPAGEKLAALREAGRVLAPGGSLHLLDLEMQPEAPANAAKRRRHHLAGNTEGEILAAMTAAGLHQPHRVWLKVFVFGRVRAGCYRAGAPRA